MSASWMVSDWWKEISITRPVMMLRSLVWFTGLRICIRKMWEESTSYGAFSYSMTVLGRISLYERTAIGNFG